MEKQLIELQEDQLKTSTGLSYLALRLNHNLNVALPLGAVRETLVLASERFTQMPNTHPCLMGLIEHRSNVFWVLDLPQLLGLPSLDSTAIETHIAILQMGKLLLGLGVYRIGQVVRFTETEILPLQGLSTINIPDEAKAFLYGVVRTEGRNSYLYLLDTQAIASKQYKNEYKNEYKT